MATASGKQTKEVTNAQDLGPAWGKAIQDFITEQGADLAKRRLAGTAYKDGDTVEVHVPVVLHLTYARRGPELDAPTIQCACIFKQYEDGSSVCICTGPGAAECDCAPIVV